MVDRPNPFDSLEDLLERLNRQLETAARSWESELDSRSQLDLSVGSATTRLDLADHGDTFVVTVDVPGYGTDDLEIKLRGGTLEISGVRERAVEDRSGGETTGADSGEERNSQTPSETYLRRERKAQSFSRQVRIPKPVDADAVTASLNNGILTVWLPKREPETNTQTIDIE